MSEDILERAKDAAENIDHYAYDCDFEEARLVILALIPEVERLRADQDAIMAAWDKDAVEKDARVQELEAERERLQSNWRQEHATAEIWKEDFRKMKKALQESELLRQAQYNQITANNARIKELEADIELLRQQVIPRDPTEAQKHALKCQNSMNVWNQRYDQAHARIQELEADRIEARAQYLLFMNDNPGCIAWNFDELDETEQDALREQARYMLELEEPWAYIQLREAREQIKRLEAAFLKSETERKFYTTINGMNSEFDWNGYPECPQNGIHKEWFRQQARDALKRIKEEREG